MHSLDSTRQEVHVKMNFWTTKTIVFVLLHLEFSTIPPTTTVGSQSIAMVDAETIQDTSVHDLPLDKAGDRQTKERSAKAERGGGAARKTANGGGRDRKGARGNESAVVQLSKALSYILRHGTAKEGLQVRPDGYVPLDAVLARPRVSKIVMESGKPPAVDDVRQVVDSNDKKRFEMKQDEDGHWLIRAVQGHSLAQVRLRRCIHACSFTL